MRDARFLVGRPDRRIDDVPDTGRFQGINRLLAMFGLGRCAFFKRRAHQKCGVETFGRTGQRLLELSENERPSKVLFVIVTDGEENASREFIRNRIFGMITHQEKEYNWEFVFIGANQDAIAEGGSLGVQACSSVNFASDSIGTQAVFTGVSEQTSRSKLMVGKKAGSFFDDDVKHQIESAGDGS